MHASEVVSNAPYVTSRTRANAAAILAVAVMLATPAAVIAQSSPVWSNLTFNETNDLTDVWFLTDNSGFTVGPNETIFALSNGGTSFSTRSVIGLDGAKCCRSIDFIDSSTGWIAGSAAMLRTTNGGSSWGGTQISGGSTSFQGVSGVSSTVGWTVSGGTYYRFTFSSGGGSVNMSSWGGVAGSGLKAIKMFDADNGIAAGASGTVVRISNGSTSPSFQIITTGGANLNAIHMLDRNVGWIAGDRGTVMKTGNGGASWSSKSTGTVNDLNDIRFRDASIGWAVGDAGLILVSTNGGETWAPEPSGTSKDLYGVHVVNNVFASGAGGVFLKRAKLTMTLGSIAPDHGGAFVQTPVTITGSGFKTGARVSFGTAAATSVNFVSATSITAVTPPLVAGTYDLVVTNPDGEVALRARAYTYVAGQRHHPVRRK